MELDQKYYNDIVAIDVSPPWSCVHAIVHPRLKWIWHTKSHLDENMGTLCEEVMSIKAVYLLDTLARYA